PIAVECARRRMKRLGPTAPSSGRWSWPEGARRNEARRDVGVVKRIELCPEHVALEPDRVDTKLLQLTRRGVPFDIVEGKICVAGRLAETPAEVGHHLLVDEVVVLQHPCDPLAMDRGREQLRQRGGNGLHQRALTHEIYVSLDG